MLVLKICCSEWKNESRDMRELSVCKELGAKVIVLAKGSSLDRGKVESVNGFQVRRYTSRPISFLPSSINRIIAIGYWARYARKLDADIISGHDLFGLTIGWLSNLFKRKKAKLVYDSHEFELGRNKKRNKFVIKLVKFWEYMMICASSATMMVNDSIAEEVKKIYRLKSKPIVVRNIPQYWDIKEDVCLKYRNEIKAGFGKCVEKIIMYHGVIGSGRGLEELLYAIKGINNVGLFILGKVLSEDYGRDFLKLVNDLHIESRVYIHDAVEMDELWKYVGAADVGICYFVPVTKSHYYVLPNKLFENIQAITPVIVSDLPEMRKIVKEYQVGLICERGSNEALKTCILQMTTDHNQYKQFLNNETKAKKELCWEKERERLVEMYKKLFDEV